MITFRSVVAIAMFEVVFSAAFGQAPVTPHFEVASIKPAPDLISQEAAGKLHTGMSVDGARVDIGAMTLADLICAAYRIRFIPALRAGLDHGDSFRYPSQDS
jgi:hypothetical protein